MNLTQKQPQELAAQAARGDRSALEALCREIWPEVRKLSLIQLGDPTLAEDAAQESLISVVRHIGRYDPTRPFGPWLRTVVRNQCRSDRRKVHPLPSPSPSPGSSVDVDQTLDLDSAARSALEAFSTLTPRQRELVDLCDRRGLAPAEAAAQLEIAQGTARALLHQARKALRTHLLKLRPDLHALVSDR